MQAKAKDASVSERLPVVYIAGKLSGKDHWEVEGYIRKAEELCRRMWLQGIAAICVHAQGRFMVEMENYETWLPGDYELIRRSDAVYMVDNWRDSPGAQCERGFAQANGKKVFYDFHSLNQWAVGWRKERNNGVS